MLEIKNLKYGYEVDKDIINSLNVQLKPKSFNSILGSNGSGKTTLVKLMAGILKADSGEVLLDGKELEDKDVAIVFQNPQDQFVRPIVYNDLAFGLENLNMSVEDINKKIKEAAKYFEIEHLLDRSVHSLSGGEMQRVAIVSNVLLSPKVLIMDEATDMLDPITRHRLLAALTKLANQKNMILIYITHDMELAFSTDNIVIMKAGQVIHSATPLATFNNTQIVEENRLVVPYNVQLMKKICGEYCYTNLQSFKDMYEIDIK